MEHIHSFFYEHYKYLGASEASARYFNMLTLLLIMLVVTYFADRITRKLLISFFGKFSEKTKTNFDDLLVNNRAPRNIAHLIPLILVIKLDALVFKDFPKLELYTLIFLKVATIILALWIVRSVLKTIESYFKTLPRLKDKPIDSYIQVVMLFLWVIGIASILAILIDISFVQFFTTLGAASAVLLLIFKDTILGFVASIQVAINDSVRIGDWITMDKYEADGEVVEINLSTVQVQNFDMTITHIPTYALISDSFKNWRGMQASGGRRIKRALIIKASSITYLTDNRIDELKEIELITNYLIKKQKSITSSNESKNVDKSVLINGLNLTNIGVFRKYLQTYIENHSAINKEMTIMVRQLEPTAQGLPLEIYCFSNDKRWENYEYIISDIFDHALAAVPYFELKLYELNAQIS